LSVIGCTISDLGEVFLGGEALAHHRKDRRQYVKDIARIRMLEDMGWIVIRVIAEERRAQWLARG